MLQPVMDLYWAGKKHEAFDMFGRVQGFASIAGATEYLMIARGVFPENVKFCPEPMEPEARKAMGGGTGGGRRSRPPLTEESKQFIRNALNEYLKPYLRA